jgi:putative ABC transport system ATP-binding protein
MSDKETPDAVCIDSLEFGWKRGVDPVLVIDHLRIVRGERIFIEGPSGSGKSTLLSLLAGVLTPDKGEVVIGGRKISRLSGAARDRLRADNIGYIFQMFNLIPYLSVIENVLLPCRFSRIRRERAGLEGAGEKEAVRLLQTLGMGEPATLKTPVTELSVGQQQRVAAARALIGRPGLIIADEPTSALDAAHREKFIQLLFRECKQEGNTLVFVSHDTSLAGMFDRTIRLPEINRSVGKNGRQGSPVMR